MRTFTGETKKLHNRNHGVYVESTRIEFMQCSFGEQTDVYMIALGRLRVSCALRVCNASVHTLGLTGVDENASRVYSIHTKRLMN